MALPTPDTDHAPAAADAQSLRVDGRKLARDYLDVTADQSRSGQTQLQLFGVAIGMVTQTGSVLNLSSSQLDALLSDFRMVLYNSSVVPGASNHKEILDSISSYVDQFFHTLAVFGSSGGIFIDTTKVKSFMDQLNALRPDTVNPADKVDPSKKFDPAAFLTALKASGDEALSQIMTAQVGLPGTGQMQWFPMTGRQVMKLQRDGRTLDYALEWDSASKSFSVKGFNLQDAGGKAQLMLIPKTKATGKPTDGPIDWNAYDAQLIVQGAKGMGMSFKYNAAIDKFEGHVNIDTKSYSAELVLGNPAAFIFPAPPAGTQLPASGFGLHIKEGPLKGSTLFMDDATGDVKGIVTTGFGKGALTGKLAGGELSELALGIQVMGRPVNCTYLPTTGSFMTDASFGSTIVKLTRTISDPQKKQPLLDAETADLQFAVSGNHFLKGLNFRYEDVTDDKGVHGKTQLAADVAVDGRPYKLVVQRLSEQMKNASEQKVFRVDVFRGNSPAPAFSFALDDDGVRQIGLQLSTGRALVKAGTVELGGSHGEAVAFLDGLIGPTWTAPGVTPPKKEEMKQYLQYINQSVGDIRDVTFVFDEGGHIEKARVNLHGKKGQLSLSISSNEQKVAWAWNNINLEYEPGVGFTGKCALNGKDGTLTIQVAKDAKDPKKGNIRSITFAARDFTGTLEEQNGEFRWSLQYKHDKWAAGARGQRDAFEAWVGYETEGRPVTMPLSAAVPVSLSTKPL